MIGQKTGELLLSILEPEGETRASENVRLDVGFELVTRETTIAAQSVKAPAQ
jgi:LacI family gluconate utilization system Gnt-I transcriptional repressor